MAYQGVGRLQEALRDLEAAEAAAEAEENERFKKMIAKWVGTGGGAPASWRSVRWPSAPQYELTACSGTLHCGL